MANQRHAVEVKNIKKAFFLPHHKNDSLKRAITQAFKSKPKGGRMFNALDGVTFDVEKGDFFGILGRNGSGKSTLLKIIAEIYQPTSGKVAHYGKMVSFIELGVGFKSELTGRENVFLNGALLGFSKKKIEAMYNDVVDFAELEEFMDQKLKNYSSGMKVRLAFSMAIRAKADILILDEVLAVGDAAFQKKCNNYFKTLKDDGKTVILVTHNMGAVRQYCSKAIVINEGKVQFEGSPDDAADKYLSLFNDSNKTIKGKEKLSDIETSGVKLKDIKIVQNNEKSRTVQFKKDFSLEMKLFAPKSYKDVVVGVHFRDQSERSIVAISSKTFGTISLKKGWNTLTLDIQNIFADGEYYVNLAIEERDTKRLLLQKHGISPFSVTGLDSTDYSKQSLVYPNIELRHE